MCKTLHTWISSILRFAMRLLFIVLLFIFSHNLTLWEWKLVQLLLYFYFSVLQILLRWVSLSGLPNYVVFWNIQPNFSNWGYVKQFLSSQVLQGRPGCHCPARKLQYNGKCPTVYYVTTTGASKRIVVLQTGQRKCCYKESQLI